MAIPTVITDLDPVAGNNSPASSESPKDGDDYIRAHAAFIAQLRDKSELFVMITDSAYGGSGDNGTTDNYTPFATAMTAFAASGGGVLYVPGGTNNKYVFKAQGANYPSIKIPSNVTIIADPDVYYIVSASGIANSGVHIYGTALFENKDMLTTGNKDISIIGGKFKSANATSGATGNGGFIAFKNCLRPKVDIDALLDIHGAARLQLSFCYGARVRVGAVDYDTPHLTPWSFEDGIRVGSGCFDTEIDFGYINSGDDCIAINNEASECQDTFTSAIDSRIPTSNVLGAEIRGVKVSGTRASNQNGNAVRLYIGPGMTQGNISRVEISITDMAPVSSTSGGSAIAISDANSSTSNRIRHVKFNGGTVDCSGLTLTANVAAVWSASTGFYDIQYSGMALTSCTQTYGFTCSAYMKITNCYVDGAGTSAIINTASGVTIDGCTLTATTNGIHLSNAQHTRIVGNQVFASVGILENSGSNYTAALGNDLSGSTTSANLASSGANSIYKSNPGLNPGGTVAVGTTGSPMTITAGYSDETITVAGGTVGNIAVGGVNTGMISGAFALPARTSMQVTYTVGPTITRTKG